jgi:hypothetical protein
MSETTAVVDYRQHLRARLAESLVPAHLHAGLVEYIAARRPVGSFLTAVLANDLRAACGRGDEWARAGGLFALVTFLFNYAPGQCWGTPALVEAWLSDPTRPPEVFE